LISHWTVLVGPGSSESFRGLGICASLQHEVSW